MARLLFVVAVLLLAVALGVLGYQSLQYLKAGDWPSVSVEFVWHSLFGPMPWATRWLPLADAWHWLGRLPIALATLATAYLSFLASDLIRAR